MAAPTAYRGVFPVVPTAFTTSGELDLTSQLRIIDYLIDADVDGICILANYSEQFVLSDDERGLLTRRMLEHVAGRVPVIVTTSHYSSRIATERSRQAQELGAAMVMLMPPYHGATIHADEEGMIAFFATVARELRIPIMLQDAPVSGVALSAVTLWGLTQEVPAIRYFKIEAAGAAEKLRRLIALGSATIEGPFDGEESVTLLPDLDAGATGTMPSSLIPDILGQIVHTYLKGIRSQALALYEQYLPLIHYENRQCGLRATKTVLHEGGIIASDHVRAPQSPLPDATRRGLLELARRLDVLALHWSH